MPKRVNFACILIGFLFHSAFLVLRGEQIGHCPISNLFEVVVFLSWALVLNYLLIGPTFQVSLMGAFTAPVVLLMNLFALLIPGIDEPRSIEGMGWMLELHAALTLLAYGTLGLSAIAAFMFLLVRSYLKSHKLQSFILRMPALGKLEKVSLRVCLLGFIMYSLGIGAGFFVEEFWVEYTKIVWSLLLWVAYIGVLAGKFFAVLSPARFTSLNLAIYLFMIGSFALINQISNQHQF